MQATKGLSRIRVVGCLMALALAFSALVFASTASARVNVNNPGYLALGDSLTFGYSQQLFNENEKAGEPPEAFEHGFASDYFNLGTTGPGGMRNDGCPGETTSSLVGNGVLGQELLHFGLVKIEAPCAYHYSPTGGKFPLHVEYKGKETGAEASQLEDAMIAVKKGYQTSGNHSPVNVVSLEAGANDQLQQVKACEVEVETEFKEKGTSKYGKTPQQALETCLVVHANSIFSRIIKNIADDLFALRFGSQFCVPAAFECTADKKGANFVGKIILGGSYDPFGRVNGVSEVLPKSNVLVFILNTIEQEKLKVFGICFANPQPSWNPGFLGMTSQFALEGERLRAWTNMANETTFEGKKNGPDIHPTPVGYQVLANELHGTCG